MLFRVFVFCDNPVHMLRFALHIKQCVILFSSSLADQSHGVLYIYTAENYSYCLLISLALLFKNFQRLV
jgi:hypothetical protein